MPARWFLLTMSCVGLALYLGFQFEPDVLADTTYSNQSPLSCPCPGSYQRCADCTPGGAQGNCISTCQQGDIQTDNFCLTGMMGVNSTDGPAATCTKQYGCMWTAPNCVKNMNDTRQPTVRNTYVLKQ
jgi:hypothetical protein